MFGRFCHPFDFDRNSDRSSSQIDSLHRHVFGRIRRSGQRFVLGKTVLRYTSLVSLNFRRNWLGHHNIAMTHHMFPGTSYHPIASRASLGFQYCFGKIGYHHNTLSSSHFLPIASPASLGFQYYFGKIDYHHNTLISSHFLHNDFLGKIGRQAFFLGWTHFFRSSFLGHQMLGRIGRQALVY